MELRLGIDVGSTTVKLVLLDESDRIVYSKYERHMSNVFEKVGELLEELNSEMGDLDLKAVITGSGGLSLANLFEIKFLGQCIFHIRDYFCKATFFLGYVAKCRHIVGFE